MSQRGKQVSINLKTMIDDNGEIENNQIHTTGKWHRKSNFDVLTFEEEIDDQHKVNNLTTIQPDRVNIKRSGIVSMNQQFLKDQLTENPYKHPYGTIHMETYTTLLDYKPIENSESGHLILGYTMTMNGEIERKHRLELYFKEESQ